MKQGRDSAKLGKKILNPSVNSHQSLVLVSLFLFAPLSGCMKKPMKSQSMARGRSESIENNIDLASSRPLDAGQMFRLGSGYDKLSGERRPTCLVPQFRLNRRPVESTESEFSVINSKEDLARKLKIEVNAEASGSYGSVGGGVSSKTQILKEANFTKDSVLGIMSFIHYANELSVEGGRAALSSSSSDLLLRDPKTFRESCGDSYSNSVMTGAAVYVVIDLKSKSSSTKNSLSTTNGVKAKLPIVFSIDVSVGFNKEQQDMLSSYEIKVSCHSIGVDASVCGQALVVDGANAKPLLEYVDRVKTAFAASVSAKSTKFVSVSEAFEDYPKPASHTEAKRQDLFYDIAPQAELVRNLLEREAEVNSICSMKSLKSCLDLRAALAKQIRYCSRQQSWVDCEPNTTQIDRLLAETAAQKADEPKIGKVVLFEKGGLGGRTMVIDFDRPENDLNGFRPDQIYNLSDYGYQDIASMFRTSLESAWQLRLFEHPDGGGRCFMVGSGADSAGDFTWFNDKASSIRLERTGQYPTSC